MPRSTDGGWAAAARAALAPYDWRGLNERMVARMVVGAVDRHSVLRFVTGMPGTVVGHFPPADPADVGDERVLALVQALSGRQWRGWSLARLCADLVCSLGSWQAEREFPDPDLRRQHER